jgi:hypothetical protein
VLFWYILISLRANSPGRLRFLGFFGVASLHAQRAEDCGVRSIPMSFQYGLQAIAIGKRIQSATTIVCNGY